MDIATQRICPSVARGDQRGKKRLSAAANRFWTSSYLHQVRSDLSEVSKENACWENISWPKAEIFPAFSLPSRTHERRKDARHYLAAAHISSPTAACEQRNPDSGNRVGEMSSTLRFHKDNLRHLSRFPDFFVTKRILSTAEGRAVEEISLGGKWWT